MNFFSKDFIGFDIFTTNNPPIFLTTSGVSKIVAKKVIYCNIIITEAKLLGRIRLS